MSKHYTDEDVRAVMSVLTVHEITPDRVKFFRAAHREATAILDAVAPAIAARELEEAAAEFASRTQEAAGQVREHWRGQDFVDGQDTAYESAAEWLDARADEIEATA